jgi:hypothetical protein
VCLVLSDLVLSWSCVVLSCVVLSCVRRFAVLCVVSFRRAFSFDCPVLSCLVFLFVLDLRLRIHSATLDVVICDRGVYHVNDCDIAFELREKTRPGQARYKGQGAWQEARQGGRTGQGTREGKVRQGEKQRDRQKVRHNDTSIQEMKVTCCWCWWY